MRQSQLFTKTRKEVPSDEVSKNAQLLIRAGFVHKEMAGVYSYLPLGLRVLKKIEQIIREELDAIGCQELEMAALQSKDVWEKTDRWRSDLDDGVWFKTNLNGGSELGLAFTHEEALTNIMKNFISSYKDLPVYAYQFQTKFRNELRAKAGLTRGREFLMKDLYDFSLNKQEHDLFYEKMKSVYKKIFERIGIGDRTYLTMSNGGTFSKYSFEFQTLCDAGEDVLVYDEKAGIAINKADFNDELLKDFSITKADYNFKEAKSVEVGDIYTLGERYSKALGLTYKDKDGEEKPVFMGSYGIGIPRVMGTLVEIFNDANGIMWPEAVAPFAVHLLELPSENLEVRKNVEHLYKKLTDEGVEVLYDDRNIRVGEKFSDADLIGIPVRVVVSEKSLKAGGAEIKRRAEKEGEIITIEKLIERLSSATNVS